MCVNRVSRFSIVLAAGSLAGNFYSEMQGGLFNCENQQKTSSHSCAIENLSKCTKSPRAISVAHCNLQQRGPFRASCNDVSTKTRTKI
jgi:hypothetical protein